jgi:hypothetical protein
MLFIEEFRVTIPAFGYLFVAGLSKRHALFGLIELSLISEPKVATLSSPLGESKVGFTALG